VAGIGLAIGSNCYLPALFTTLLAIFALLLLPLFERSIKRDKYKTLKLCVSGSEPDFTAITEILKRNSMELQQYSFERNLVQNEIVYNINVRYKDEASVTKVSDEVARSVKEIRKLGWE
jgi:putative Mg2+ transporter-C (MgtC) family protein